MGTKFVWPDPGPKFKDVNLTAEKEERWKKWIGLYNEKMLSKGEFRDLYVTGYDTPEAYAIAKDGKMYYAFFVDSAAPWKGEVELRGLKPGKVSRERLRRGKDLGTVDAGRTVWRNCQRSSRIICCWKSVRSRKVPRRWHVYGQTGILICPILFLRRCACAG